MYSIIIKGGIVMIPIMAGSIIALAIFFERIIYFYRIKRFNKSFSRQIKNNILNGDISSAGDLCLKYPEEPLANIFLAGINNRLSGKETIKESIIESANFELPKLERYLSSLGTIATIEPLLGLLGTVTGMIRAFSVIAQQGLVYSPGLAGGISEALITTAAGLIIGIPSLIMHHYFVNKSDRITLEMEKESIEVLKLLSK